jgi:hypothetical protein
MSGMAALAKAPSQHVTVHKGEDATFHDAREGMARRPRLGAAGPGRAGIGVGVASVEMPPLWSERGLASGRLGSVSGASNGERSRLTGMDGVSRWAGTGHSFRMGNLCP